MAAATRTPDRGRHRIPREGAGASTGAAPAKLPELRVQLAALLERTLASPAGRALLDPSGKAASFSELPILARDGNRIVRSIIDLAWQDVDGDWHTVDFKTGTDSAEARVAWESQLEHYSGLLQQVTGIAPRSASIYGAGQGVLLGDGTESDPESDQG